MYGYSYLSLLQDDACEEFEKATHGVRSDPSEVADRLATMEKRKAKAEAAMRRRAAAAAAAAVGRHTSR